MVRLDCGALHLGLLLLSQTVNGNACLQVKVVSAFVKTDDQMALVRDLVGDLPALPTTPAEFAALLLDRRRPLPVTSASFNELTKSSSSAWTNLIKAAEGPLPIILNREIVFDVCAPSENVNGVALANFLQGLTGAQINTDGGRDLGSL
jgi:hypothetical protein